MRTLPLFSSVAHTPIGELAATTGAAATGAGAGAGAAATAAGAAATGAGSGVMALATGGGGATRLVVAGAAGAAATGATGAAATGAATGAVVVAGGVVVVVVFAGGGSDTSSSLSFEPKPLRSILPSLPLKPGASIWMHDSELQPRGDSMRTRWPSIWIVTPLPAWAELVAKSSAVAAAK